MTTKRHLQGWFAICAAAGLMSCGGAKQSEDDISSQQGMQLKMEITADTGVTGMHFEIVSVSCVDGTPLPGGTPTVVDKPLDALRIPGGVAQLEDNPLTTESSHAFADEFVTVAAGCYDVTTTPVTTSDVTCHPAHQAGVTVSEGQTTEVFLLNQCDGHNPGAIDAIAAANHPPVLLDLAFATSKFVASCEDQVVCATAQDPENDRIEFVWTRASGPATVGPLVKSQTANPDGSITQCVRMLPQDAGRVGVTVTVYDVLHNGKGFQRIEDWLAAQGYPSASHTSLDFPFYATAGRTPVAEICGDGIDNDCDGTVDDPDECKPIPPEGCPAGTTPVCTGLIDIVLLEDLSGSFYDDLPAVRSLAPKLAEALTAASPGVGLGVASLVDKPFAPFGAPGDYVYDLSLPVTTTAADFVTAINRLATKSGNDYSESQLEALNLLANNSGPAGFRADAKHFVVLATDSTFHQAGDCTSSVGGCTSANNSDAVADLREDYPSPAQAITSLNAAQITPVFAIAGGSVVKVPYQVFVSNLGRGNVVDLSSDSSNLLNAIFTGLGDSCTCG
jgi:hypothetical protein